MEFAMSTVDDKRAVAMLAALSQPTRLKIVQFVAGHGDEGVPAGRIAQAVECPPSTLSFHLKELSQAGLLTPHPKGRIIRYTVVPESFARLGRFVSGIAGRGAPSGNVRASRKGATGRKAKAAAGSAEPENQLSIFED